MYSVKLLKVSFSFMRNFTYIIFDESSKQAAIVDPAWEFKKIVDALDELGARLTAILLTHSHIDHINMVQPLMKRFNPQVYMSAREIEFYHFTSNNLNPVEHLDVIDIGQTRLSCLLTPGHTAGSLCFLLSDSLFTGDTIFIEGCGICIARGGCPERMFDSIQKIKETVHPDVRIFPGHSFGKEPGYSLSHLMEKNIYFQIQDKQQFIDFRMRKQFGNFFDFH